MVDWPGFLCLFVVVVFSAIAKTCRGVRKKILPEPTGSWSKPVFFLSRKAFLGILLSVAYFLSLSIFDLVFLVVFCFLCFFDLGQPLG